MPDINYDNPFLLDNILKYLREEDAPNKFLSFTSKLAKQVGRAANKAFIDGVMYDEKLASKVLKDFINSPQVTKKLRPQHDKIMQIYERLTHLSHGKTGTWADGIDRDILLRLGTLEEEEAQIPEFSLQKRVLVDVFMPDAPEDQIFEAEQPIKKEPVIDPKGEHHTFHRIPGLTPPDHQLLFHIHADEFGSSSQLEGSKAGQIIPYVHQFLKRALAGSPPQLLEQVSQTVYWTDNRTDEEKMEEAEQKVKKALETKTPLLMEGGWTGQPAGHAIYYEIVPQQDGKVNFRLYNTGAGVKDHPSAVRGHKLKYRAYEEWRGIDPSSINSLRFRIAMLEMNTRLNVPGSPRKTVYAESDIYQGLKEILNPAAVETAPLTAGDEELLMTPQRSGVCAWRSLMAFLRTKMELNDYKRFKCDIKLQSLLDFIAAHPDKVTLEDWRLVKKSYANLCQSIVKLHQRKLVGDAYLIQAQEELAQAAQWIKDHSKVRYERAEAAIPSHYVASTAGKHLVSSIPLTPEEMGPVDRAHLAAPMQPWSHPWDKLRNVDVSQPDRIAQALDQAIAICEKAWVSKEDMALHQGLIQLVRRLSSDEEFWKKAIAKDKKQGERLIVQLGRLTHLFAQSCFTVPQPEVIFSDKVYLMYKSLFIQKIIMTQLFPAWNALLPFPHSIDASFFLRFPDVQMQSEMKAIMGSVDNGTIRISNYTYKSPFGTTSSSWDFKEGRVVWRLPEGQEGGFNNVQDLILMESPELSQTIPGLHEMASHTRDAYLFASDQLPDWLKAVRNGAILNRYLLESPIGQLEGLDREKDLILEFNVVPGKDQSTVTMSLRGVNEDILKTHAVKAVQTNPYLRFAGMYRKINSPALETILCKIAPSDLGEKWAANTHAKEKAVDLADEEFRELVRLFSTKELSIIEGVEYFTKHPEKLKDTDYQTVFHLLLFRRPSKLLDNKENVGAWLAHFMRQKYENFSEENEIQTALFLLKTAHQLRQFFPNDPFYQSTLEQVKGLLQREGIDEDLKPLIYAELVAELGHQELLTEEEIALLVAGSVYIEENQQHSRVPSDPETLKEAREALNIHADKIEGELKRGAPNHRLLNQIVHLLRPDLKGEMKWVVEEHPGEFPLFRTVDGTQLLYPLAARLISPHVEVLLPYQIRQNPQFQELFPEIIKGVFVQGNRFTFKDAKGMETIVGFERDRLVIDQNQQGEWLRNVPASMLLFDTEDRFGNPRIESKLGSRYVTQHFTHWQRITPEKDGSHAIFSIDSREGKRKFQTSMRKRAHQEVLAEYELKKRELYAKRDELKLTAENFREFEAARPQPAHSYYQFGEVINLEEGMKLSAPSQLLGTIEDAAYIHEWYDKAGKLQKVELPRFNLTFRPHPQKAEALVCEQFPGFVLNPHHAVKALGVHHRYLVLENSQRQRKVLVPQQPLIPTNPKETLKPSYANERSLKRGQLDPEKYYVYDVNHQEQLFTKSREANLYLAEVMAAAQEYKKAAYYLMKFGKKLSRFTPDEDKILESISAMDQITGDQSGNGTVLQLYADLLRLKNALSHHQNIQLPSLEIHYNRYLNHYANVTVFKLLPDEEIFILKHLLSSAFNPMLFMRLKELDPAAAKNLEIPEDKKEDELKVQPVEIPQVTKYTNFDEVPGYEVLYTRPYHAMSQYFNYFYKQAKGSEGERLLLKARLAFLRVEDQGAHAGLARFFDLVVEHPQAFPLPLTNSIVKKMGEVEVEEWMTAVRKAVHELEQEPEPAKPPQEIDASGFALGGRPKPPPVVVIQPELMQLEGLSQGAKGCFTQVLGDRDEEVRGIAQFIGTFRTNDPIQERERERLALDLAAYCTEPPPSTYSLTPQGLAQVKKLLGRDRQEDIEILKTLEEGILRIANLAPQKAEEAALAELERAGKLKKVITLEELIVSYARNDFGRYLERNPALDADVLQEIANMVGLYLLHATRHQHRGRSEELLKKLEKCKPADRAELENQLAAMLLAQRSFNPVKNPAYLVFEYLANISMREAQVEKLGTFLSGGALNPVMEMIMGSGKSKVLLPLLGLLRADRKKISLLVVPQPLFESVSQDTQSILQGFQQSLSSLHFDRQTQFTPQRLEAIYDQLVSVRDNADCLIMTSKSIQCLIDKFVEGAALHFRKQGKPEAMPVELKWLQKIVSLLSASGDPIFDEADTLLNILHEVSFSTGDTVPPRAHELKVLSSLYGLIYADPRFKGMARIESDPTAEANAPALTEELYREQMQKPLAEALIDLLKTMTFESKPLTDKVQKFAAGLSPQGRVQLMHYLCRDKDHLVEAQRFFDSLDPEVQDIVAFAGEQLSHLLPFTLSRICDEKYGLDENSRDPLAIPFSASQTPSTGSQFSNPHITMNYTIQTYMKKGIPLKTVEQMVGMLQEKAMQENVSTGGKVSIRETAAGKAFASLKGDYDMPLFNYSPVQLETLCRRVNSSPESKLMFVQHFILPQLEQMEFKISCNPHNLVSFFSQASGFTGTLWNGVSMHHMLNPEPALGTDSKTLSLLRKNSKDNAVQIHEGSLDQMLGQLKQQGVAFDMISDAGGYFKEGNNGEMAHAIARAQGKAVVFYNSKGEQSVTKGEGEIPLDQAELAPDERLTFLDQSHTTGADVPQKLDAVSIVTIGRTMLLRDLLQSVWRLRGLDKAQKVRFVVSDEVAAIIRQKLELADDHPIQLEQILKFVIANQADQQGRDNYKALRAGFANIMQKMLLTVLMNDKLTPEAQAQAVLFLMSTWIKPSTMSARELYGALPTDADAAKVLEIDRKGVTDKISAIFKQMPWLEQAGINQKSCLQEIDQIVAKIKESLPKMLQLPVKEIDDDQTVEVERELNVETERETQLEVQEAKEEEKVSIKSLQGYEFKRYASFAQLRDNQLVNVTKIYEYNHVMTMQRDLGSPVFSLQSYLETDPLLKDYASVFEGIDITLDVLEWTRDEFRLLGTRRTDFHHLMVQGDRLILMSQGEAAQRQFQPDYYNLTLGFVDPAKKLKPELQFAVVKLKFLNGESQFSREELQYLKLWFKTRGTEKMRSLYEKHILTGYPQKTARYQGSSLQRLFSEMK